MALLNIFLLSPSLVLFVCTIVLLYLINRHSHRARINYPPGPTPLPIIGNLHQLDRKRIYKSLFELSEKYGSVYSIQIGATKAVVLVGYETVKDALVHHPTEFMGRPFIPVIHMLKEGSGVTWSNGEPWKQMRRFVLSTLRDFGMGKKSIEERINEEAGFLVAVIESYKGQPFDASIILNSATANIICSILFGHRFDTEEETFLSLVKMTNDNFKLLASPMLQIFNSYPFLRFLPGVHRKVFQYSKETKTLLNNIINQRRSTLNEGNVSGLIDRFLVKQKEESGNPDTLFHDKNLLIATHDLFAAGMDTTATTLRWGLLLMMKYQEIQKRVQEEIDQVIGSKRCPRMEDQKHMPYTRAVIHEVQRFANIAPMGVPRETTVDINFRGYFIPKGSCIFPLLTSVLYDKTQWEKPDEFNPAHFLDEEGKFVNKDAFMPFSAGRRICAGETLAKVELFLFFSTMLQRFHLHAPPSVTNLDITPAVGAILMPKPHKMCAVPR
ncbi:cytochrome P450 2K6-like [Heterodontus francisci]|uniref:cytochrome P450 2K6-like n=1 Tax=Heterodontus francisci TaxID=7792 RepID=UPI00355C0AAF